MHFTSLRVGELFIVSVIVAVCLLVESEARHYVLIRRVYAGEEGRAMLERDESSRLLGWPLGVSSEIAFLDSAPIFRALVEKDSADSSNNEVFATSGGVVSRPPPLQSGRGGPRRVEDSSSESQKSEVAAGETAKSEPKAKSETVQKDDQGEKQPKFIDIHNHEPDTAETHGSNSTQGKDTASSEKSESTAENASASSDDDGELESINIEDIEKIMASHKIRIMGAPHPMAKIELDHERAESVVGDQRHPATSDQSGDQDAQATEQVTPTRGKKKGAVPDQVMRIAEWLLNQSP